MADGGSPKKARPGKWYGLHPYTVVALTLTGTILISANLSPKGGGDGVTRTLHWTIARGWPATAVRVEWSADMGDPPYVPEDAERHVESLGVVIDILVALGALVLVALLCEWCARSPSVRWPHLHRSSRWVLLLTAEALFLANAYYIQYPIVKRGDVIYDHTYGWPAWQRAGPWPSHETVEEGAERGWQGRGSHPAVANMLFALSVLAAVALLCEGGIRAYKRLRAGSPETHRS